MPVSGPGANVESASQGAGLDASWVPYCIPHGRIEINMRQLRAFITVAHCGTVNGAAKRLHITQPAVTRTIRALEEEFRISLFERTPRGMITTEQGELMLTRACRALGYIELAEQELEQSAHERDSRALPYGLVSKLTYRHLLSLIGIADFQSEAVAAHELGMSRRMLALSIRELELTTRAPLFLRKPQGMVATTAGEIMVRRAKLAVAEISAVTDDMAAKLGFITGKLVVGALTLSGTLLAPRAIARLANQYPDLMVTVIEGQYHALIQGLRCGDIDLIVGALHTSPAPDLRQEQLFDDSLAVVVRPGHPLASKKKLTLEDVAGAQWVIPYRRTPTRNVFEKAVLAAGIQISNNAIEASSPAMVRGVLRDSDRLSVLSRRQSAFEVEHGLLATLDLDLHGCKLAIGVTTRNDAMSSPSMAALLECLRTDNGESELQPRAA